MRTVRCAECSNGTVRPLKKAGRVTIFHFRELPVPRDLAIPTCDKCGTEWIDDESAKSIDEAMRTVHERSLREETQVAIRKLSESVPKSHLEHLLGLAQGYLTHLDSGDRIPSEHLTAALMLLAANPNQRIAELQRAMKVEGWQSRPAREGRRPRDRKRKATSRDPRGEQARARRAVG